MSEKLTEAQLWALKAIKNAPDITPQYLGEEMMKRPGSVPEWRKGYSYKAQGYGRMGGAMMARLQKAGLIVTSGQTRGQWHPTQARLTPAGRAAISREDGER